ncbi:hypothetical protein ACP70R_046466 [Stipagrostis hirtigluma subsp. patula]
MKKNTVLALLCWFILFAMFITTDSHVNAAGLSIGLCRENIALNKHAAPASTAANII